MAVNVLLVEDEGIVALHLRLQLQKLGYQVGAIAASGAQALRSVFEVRPDVVLMDIHLNGDIDGIDTAACIPPDLLIPVIYLTAYSEEGTLARARATKPFGYLIKPFSERELHATIQMAMERRAVELALRESEERLSLALEVADMGCWEVDAASHRMVRTGRADSIFGIAADIFSGTWEDFLALVRTEDRADVNRALERALSESGACQVTFRSAVFRSSAAPAAGSGSGGVLQAAPVASCDRWLRTQGRAFPAGADDPRRIIGVVQDITEQRRAEARLREAATVFESTREGILILDTDLTVLTVNPGYCAQTGWEVESLIGHGASLFSRDALDSDTYQALRTALVRDGHWQGEFRAWKRNGAEFPVHARIAPVRSAPNGVMTHYVAIISDMTATRRAEAELQRLAHYDHLTGLPNRLLAMDRLQHAMDRVHRHGGGIGVLFVDLDHFKTINDTLGHGAGDELLRCAAQRMRTVVRTEDTVARLGGDEFMVIVEQIEEPEAAASAASAARIAGSIIAALVQPAPVAGHSLTVSASIGISLYPGDGSTRDELIRAADTAMYAAKQLGRHGYTFYAPEMTTEALRIMKRSQELRRALERQELVLYYQPQVSLRTGRITGVEALVRWQHPRLGLLDADEVVPVAERSGQILEIGEWVLRRACEQACRLWADMPTDRPRMAVNVSAQQLRDGRLERAVERVLAETGLPPDRLELEITESMLQNESQCLAALKNLKAQGIALAIDDFGTGYSCLASLKALPIQRLKIHQGFVCDLPFDEDSAAIVEAIIAMAHRLRMRVIAEGIETPEQEQFLRARGCEEGQGYLYARPLSAESLAEMIRTRV